MTTARRLSPAASQSGTGVPRVGILRGTGTGQRAVVPVVADPRRHGRPDVIDTAAIDDIRQRAQDEGFRSGYEAGVAAAREETQAAVDEAKARFGAALGALTDAAADLREREAHALVDLADQTALLALRIAEIVLDREVATATDPGRDAIARAVAYAPTEGPIRFRLNPADLATLGDIGDLTPGREHELVPDPTVAIGGCVAQVGATRVDAQLSEALGRVAEVLR